MNFFNQYPTLATEHNGKHRRPSAIEIPNTPTSMAPPFVGKAPEVLKLLNLATQIADTDATVLITGESGTGKELIARYLHEQSSRRRSPFIAVNCGAIAETLQESELFGHAKGAFTGAITRKIGKFEAADKGTIFLDEVSEMSHALQVKLLRILQSGEYSPVGYAGNCYCEARVVAATNRDLQELVTARQFRADLYYRLNIIRLLLPPLRERKRDIPLLIDHFLDRLRKAYHKPGLEISPEAENILLQHDYPGNVRELENILRGAAILAGDGSITLQQLPTELLAKKRHSADGHCDTFHQAKARAVEEFERDYLTAVLADCGGIVSRAAQRSGLSERIFHEKLRKYGISGKSYRAQA
jgi:DNA-binding NtrC family response regulator